MMEAVVEEKVVEEPKVDTKPEWDKERQRADQAEANLRKSQSRLNESDLKTQQLEKTVSDMQDKMSQIEAVKGLDLTELDPDKADVPEIVREYSKMSKVLEETTKKLTALEQKANSYEKDAESSRQELRKEAVIERICKPLDKKYGVSFRNEAKKLAEDEVTERGYSPEDALECSTMIEKYYIQLSEKAVVKKETTPSDNGHGGSKTTFGDNIKPGKLNDVMGQIRKDGGLKALIKKN
jgi:chromosome segregation ATPase